MKNIIVKSEYHFINSVSEIFWGTFLIYLAIVFCVWSVDAYGILGFAPLAILALSIFFKKKGYETISYEIKEGSVEEQIRWINHASHSISYADIKEVMLLRGIMARKHGLGTIRIITNATTRGAGMTIDNIREYQEVYDFIKAKIGNNRYKPL
jgi:membrane protein YdbS with pleckstrin-like domain